MGELLSLKKLTGGENYYRIRVGDYRIGAIYDALHVHCAEAASVSELRTLNGREFRRMPPADPTELVVL